MPGTLAAASQPWNGPSLDWIGGWIPWNFTVGYSTDALLVIREAEVYPEGILCSFHARLRSDAFEHKDAPNSRPKYPGLAINGGLRLSAQMADGRRTSALGRASRDDDGAPSEPVLRMQGGSGSLLEYKIRMWLWPLPPPGLLTWSVAWPQCGVQETDTVIEISDINVIASQAHPIWVSQTVQ
jgi:hypothetical protein